MAIHRYLNTNYLGVVDIKHNLHAPSQPPSIHCGILGLIFQITPDNAQHTFLLREESKLEHNLNRFWEVESVEQSTMTAEQKACDDHFLTHTTQQPDGTFVVRLPTKMEPTQLGTSRLSAEGRLHAIKHRMEQDPDLKVQYHNFMKEYEELGHMEPVIYQEGKSTCYFLPHTQSLRKQVPQQRLELCLMEVPRLQMDRH
jgi:hypothetical protein